MVVTTTKADLRNVSQTKWISNTAGRTAEERPNEKRDDDEHESSTEEVLGRITDAIGEREGDDRADRRPDVSEYVVDSAHLSD